MTSDAPLAYDLPPPGVPGATSTSAVSVAPSSVRSDEEQLRLWSLRARQAYDCVLKRLRRAESVLRVTQQKYEDLKRSTGDVAASSDHYRTLAVGFERRLHQESEEFEAARRRASDRESELQNANDNLRTLASTFLDELRQLRERCAQTLASCHRCSRHLDLGLRDAATDEPSHPNEDVRLLAPHHCHAPASNRSHSVLLTPRSSLARSAALHGHALHVSQPSGRLISTSRHPQQQSLSVSTSGHPHAHLQQRQPSPRSAPAAMASLPHSWSTPHVPMAQDPFHRQSSAIMLPQTQEVHNIGHPGPAIHAPIYPSYPPPLGHEQGAQGLHLSSSQPANTMRLPWSSYVTVGGPYAPQSGPRDTPNHSMPFDQENEPPTNLNGPLSESNAHHFGLPVTPSNRGGVDVAPLVGTSISADRNPHDAYYSSNLIYCHPPGSYLSRVPPGCVQPMMLSEGPPAANSSVGMDGQNPRYLYQGNSSHRHMSHSRSPEEPLMVVPHDQKILPLI